MTRTEKCSHQRDCNAFSSKLSENTCHILVLFWLSALYFIIIWYTFLFVGRDSSVGIVTRYGLDGPGIESVWGRDCPHPLRLALELTHPPIQWVQGLSRG
jgi:hypothetical protein